MLRVLTLLISFSMLVACAGEGSTLRELAEDFNSNSSADNKALVDQLTVNEHFVLEFVGKQFKEAVFRDICQVDSSLVWSYLSDGSRSNCAYSVASWQQAVSFVGEAVVQSNAELGRNEVLVYYKCESGEIDAATCATYNAIMGQVAAGSAATSQTIIDNTGNKCEVGSDPNCYP